jgi:hypothetical protein
MSKTLKHPGCEKEPLILEAVHSGLWDEKLCEHASDCENCTDAAATTLFLQQIDRSGLAGASLPGAGQMWWKAQLRARRDAIKCAARPISLAQSTALLFAALSMVGVCIWEWTFLRNWIDYFVGMWHLSPPAIGDFALNLWKSWSFVLTAGAGVAAVFVTLVVLLACSKD